MYLPPDITIIKETKTRQGLIRFTYRRHMGYYSRACRKKIGCLFPDLGLCKQCKVQFPLQSIRIHFPSMSDSFLENGENKIWLWIGSGRLPCYWNLKKELATLHISDKITSLQSSPMAIQDLHICCSYESKPYVIPVWDRVYTWLSLAPLPHVTAQE